MFSEGQIKGSRRSSFLIRDLLSTASSRQMSSAPPRGLPQGHPRGAAQINFTLSRPGIARMVSHQQAYFHLGFNCPSCPTWTPGSCLGFLHGKHFLPGQANFSQSEIERHGGLTALGDTAFPVPIPLPVYVRTRSPNSPTGGTGKHRKSRRSRTVFTELQLMGLERRFDKQKYLSTPDRIELADTLALSQIQVKTWYQNRRMKWKKQVLSAGGTEPPTKPKGRPKKNSIPSADDIMAAELKLEGMDANKSREAELSLSTDTIVQKS